MQITHNEALTVLAIAGIVVSAFGGWLARGPRSRALDNAFDEGKLVGYDLAGTSQEEVMPDDPDWNAQGRERHPETAPRPGPVANEGHPEPGRTHPELAETAERVLDDPPVDAEADKTASPYSGTLTPAQRRRDRHKRRGEYAPGDLPDPPTDLDAWWADELRSLLEDGQSAWFSEVSRESPAHGWLAAYETLAAS